jgi:hypothetical protein
VKFRSNRESSKLKVFLSESNDIFSQKITRIEKKTEKTKKKPKSGS